MEQIKNIEAWLKSQVPMIEYSALKVQELNQHRCKILIPFLSQNQNHLKSMYFGALAIGADAAAGLLAYYLIQQTQESLNVQFKDFKANFLKRAYDDLCFECSDEAGIQEAIEKVIAEKKRVNIPVYVKAYAIETPEETVAEFELTLSIK
ncbi:MAG: hypothetical protein K0S08_2054 [Gammaproteobacteria bacterium]|jgi:acyl-coenzyme A thioesterase PaaI-like protein|nr:hypothetical protein [Gammaproteobacteria bacterium]